MAKNKFYAVRIGKNPGIYDNWDECSAQVSGFKGAKYKSFDNRDDAVRFINGEIDYEYKDKSDDINKQSSDMANDMSDEAVYGLHKINVANKKKAKEKFVPCEDVYCFVDGSYNPETKVYGCGGFLMAYGQKYIIQESGDDEEAAAHRNVSGEVLGAKRAVEKAVELGLPEITVYHDYNGICGWASGWKTNIPLTQDYKAFMDRARQHINIKFKQVPAHTGIEGNEEADRLAKEAVGLKA